MPTDTPTAPDASDLVKVAARSLRIDDRIPVMPGAYSVRLSSVAGLAADAYAVATVTGTECRPLDFQYVATDAHDGPLVFLVNELVAILPRRPAADVRP